MGEFEKDIKNIFDNVEITPSPKVWDGLEGSLRENSKKGFFLKWYHYSIAAGIVAVIGLNALFIENQLEAPTDAIKQKQLTDNSKPVRADSALSKKQDNVQKSGALPRSKALTKKGNDNSAITGSLKSSLTLADDQGKIMSLPVADQEEPTQSRQTVNINPLELLPFQQGLSVIYQLQWRNKYLVASPDFIAKVQVVDNQNPRTKSLIGTLENGLFNPAGSSGIDSEMPLSFANKSAMNGVKEDVITGESQQESSFSVGVGMKFSLNRKWALNAKINFGQFKFSSFSNAYSEEDDNHFPVYAPAGFNQESVYFVGEYGLKNTISVISLPVSFSYKFLNLGKFNVALKAGLGLDYMMSYKIEGDLNFLETRYIDFSETDAFNRFNLSGLSGLDFNYKLNEKFGLTVEIFYRKYLTSANGSNEFINKPTFYGFGLSVNYFLNKN